MSGCHHYSEKHEPHEVIRNGRGCHGYPERKNTNDGWLSLFVTACIFLGVAAVMAIAWLAHKQ